MAAHHRQSLFNPDRSWWDMGDGAGVAVDTKGILPMSKKPTRAQKRRWSRIVSEIGCLASYLDGEDWTPCEIHHCGRYGYRDHDQVYGLAPVRHKMTSSVPGVLNRHRDPIEFAAKYGTDAELNLKVRELLGEIT